MIKWNFPSNNNAGVNGISDPGVETFQGTPLQSLAREICQNSLDARLDCNKPVLVQFKSFEIDPCDIPDHESLVKTFTSAKEFWSDQEYSKVATDFFKKAISESKKSRIHCLRISDFNTKGLTGSDKEYKSPWCNLTKSQGVSDKAGVDGGSKGIGKYAPFVCSSYRTVFYSTLDIENRQASQGIARLTSFKDETGDITLGMGFYGGEKNTPLPNQISLDPDFKIRSSDYGTDIYVLGFEDNDSDWESKMIASVMDGFLYAVFCGNLIVKVNNIIISKDTLPELSVSYKEYFNEYADKYYSVLSADESVSPVFTKEIFNLGKITLRLMISQELGLHKKVAMVRKTGMKIFDKGYINGIIPFAGVLYIDGDDLNAILRDLENPQHTEWQLDRASDKATAKKVTSAFTRFIKECLDKLKTNESKEALDAPVGEFLAAEQPEENTPEEKSENVNDAVHDIQIKTITKSSNSSSFIQSNKDSSEIDDENGDVNSDNIPGEGGRSGEAPGGRGEGGGGSGTGTSNEPNPTKCKRRHVSEIPAKTRIICLDRENGRYRISLTPGSTADDGYADLFMAAESDDYKAEIVSVSCNEQPDIKFSGNRITNIKLQNNNAIIIEININYHEYCSMEVKLYGYKN